MSFRLLFLVPVQMFAPRSNVKRILFPFTGSICPATEIGHWEAKYQACLRIVKLVFLSMAGEAPGSALFPRKSCRQAYSCFQL
ncbi:MAG: hypothetical protein DSY89_10175 [Deltaproteobacteria bacterium]|nr:MAG: hypothetical protein DSY89_10175 [Deltaproteobacteria bacterium]